MRDPQRTVPGAVQLPTRNGSGPGQPAGRPRLWVTGQDFPVAGMASILCLKKLSRQNCWPPLLIVVMPSCHPAAVTLRVAWAVTSDPRGGDTGGCYVIGYDACGCWATRLPITLLAGELP